MNIILIAHEKKKELLLRFCEAYNSVLKNIVYSLPKILD